MDHYIRLDYRQYKHIEEQLRHFDEIETVHKTVEGYYHKAIRLEVGDVTFEFQGPLVMEPMLAAEPNLEFATSEELVNELKTRRAGGHSEPEYRPADDHG